MWYVYILQSEKDQSFYTGFTENLERRIKEHNDRKSRYTKAHLPYRVVYFEGSLNKKDALKREIYLKTSWGKRYVKNRIRNYLGVESPVG